ncbi:hypothetical protein ACLEX4_08210 [Pseudescherichia vulneris]
MTSKVQQIEDLMKNLQAEEYDMLLENIKNLQPAPPSPVVTEEITVPDKYPEEKDSL